ncbi:patatin like phospholipase domain containing 5 [Rhinolophus ferrumequinum]|uniref:Patatin-like phospholipase domain-containing protein 5 n=2 Tax=Rhinolophus ferrumequinum TaxID=59479 RepID=A0A7J7WS74_RHIFE|nr:patatin-like phospholipase domain-containing protein 5 [Rhinolophus ferrumequinum]KAF6340211.1 patatin like phospholipase domain containing 5 [Rhinolophus ferrumequinum]
MGCFEEEGSWNLSFSGAAFLGLYHVGVTHCLTERAPRLLQGARRFYGSSSGTLNALCILLDESIEFSCSQLLDLVKQVEQLSLGVLHPAFAPIEHVRQRLQDFLPANIHILASQRLGVSLTRWPDGHNVMITDFASRDEVIQAVLCSLYFPFYCGIIPPEFRGERYFDGALSNTLPFADCPNTITVSPFHGTMDICPPSMSASMHELNACNANFQICTDNFFLGLICFTPPNPEIVADSCRQGYLDALRFLERRGLTKEPVLWTLVSKEPPAPADGTRDAGHDQGQEAGLSLNWAVPNVLVKDVPDFEKVSPELEAALKKACMRDPRPWARFCRSRPGRALTYLLLPCTLPFEYVYFRSKRLMLWLPDLPADLCWMQGVLRSLALGVYSRTKDQLVGLVKPAGHEPPLAQGSSSCAVGQETQTCPPISPEGHQAGPAQ